ncbi:hypothetical protein RZS08_48770, partial [Arthrospira platensis SPKY1]|nr:hypothetical protein [Arthrospira platensis SPKY1]
MVAAAEAAAPFQCPQVGHVLDHADDAVVPGGIFADAAGIRRVQVAAAAAGADSVTGGAERPDQWIQQGVPAFQHE